jgi:hypothetical protein
MKFPSKETIARLRAEYPIGTRIELISMDDPYSKLRPGDRGTVTGVDDTGTIFARWDNGSGLGIVYGVDQARRVEPEIQYETGADFFRATAVSHGLKEALGICGRYLKVQLKTESTEERQFCRELFLAMMEATAGRTDPTQLVYPFPFEKAEEHSEASLYQESRDQNMHCAHAIDNQVEASRYSPNFYNIEIAAMSVIREYGFQRVNAVLAFNLQNRDIDARYSRANKAWANAIVLPEGSFDCTYLNAHPILIESFTNHTRKLYEALGAERFALPGAPEAGVEMSTEQNYNMIDGLHNNMAVPKADLTDGQTHEEIRELAPETLAGEKPSVLGRSGTRRRTRNSPRPRRNRPGRAGAGTLKEDIGMDEITTFYAKVDIIAAWEEEHRIPFEKRLTYWFGNYGMDAPKYEHRDKIDGMYEKIMAEGHSLLNSGRGAAVYRQSEEHALAHGELDAYRRARRGMPPAPRQSIGRSSPAGPNCIGMIKQKARTASRDIVWSGPVQAWLRNMGRAALPGFWRVRSVEERTMDGCPMTTGVGRKRSPSLWSTGRLLFCRRTPPYWTVSLRRRKSSFGRSGRLSPRLR